METTAGDPPVPDPYRWLEGEDEEVLRWQRWQNALTTEVLGDLPARVRDLVDGLMVDRAPSLPRFAGGRWFHAKGSTVVRSDEPFGDGATVVDIGQFADRETEPFLSWLSPSPDGAVLAIGVCTDGSEQNTIRLIDTATGVVRDDAPSQVLFDGWTGGAIWLPDSTGFWFTAVTGSVFEVTKGVFLHRLGAVTTDPEPIPLPAGTMDYVIPQAGGRWTVIAHGLATPVPYAVHDGRSWRPFITDVSATIAGHIVGDRYVAVTDLDAPRGRLVAIDLDSDTPNDPSTWTELVPESDAVLRTVTPVADLLYLSQFVDTYAQISIVDSAGRRVGEVPLPARGAISEGPFPGMSLVRRGHDEQMLLSFSTPTRSWSVLRHIPGADSVEVLRPPETGLPDATVTDLWATSADGTRIPYHVISPPGADEALPTLIYAYGGFNAPFLPQYPPKGMAAFVAAGGRLVLAHLRGGGELGRDWWHGGRMQTKQNCYADLYAVAQELLDQGRASRLGIAGASNGGLLASVALTQRPELWSAVIPLVPLCDIVGALREPYGRMVIDIDYGHADDPADVRRMLGFSPYHLVRDGVTYPPVFIEAGDTDPRCPPWHARKLTARLQAAQAGPSPVLMRIWENVGHGWATPRDTALSEAAEWLSFAMHHLQLLPSRSAVAPGSGGSPADLAR
ncbi:prolyl oligopeptidase family serine peptidase [Amycolatopsis minnesotensis]|uniref:Prolyl oligopeptidase family serine peptidase n=1 Tax=Amycolatopsis minnesotensis TaxID=337894 RepID=A0ABP5C3D3_9PSEU